MSEEIIKRYKIKAKKALGQNFLVNDSIVEEIASAVYVEGENIVEVGPGYGALTEKLLKHNPASLTLVELDKAMITILEDRIKKGELDSGSTEFSIQNVDVLKFEPESEKKYSVIANIPYYITSPILRHFLYSVENTPENMVILLQKDVGDKILEGQRESYKVKSSVLALIVAKKAYVREVCVVNAENFIPAPKVESSVLKFVAHDKYEEYSDKDFLRVIKIAFTASRKKLSKNLINGGFAKELVTRSFGRLNIDPMVRPENLDVDIWCKLSKELCSEEN